MCPAPHVDDEELVKCPVSSVAQGTVLELPDTTQKSCL